MEINNPKVPLQVNFRYKANELMIEKMIHSEFLTESSTTHE